MITNELKVDKPGDLGLYSGCRHELEETIVNGKSIVPMTCNMEDYFNSIVTHCRELSSQLLVNEVMRKPVVTPFLEDNHKSSLARAPAPNKSFVPLCQLPRCWSIRSRLTHPHHSSRNRCRSKYTVLTYKDQAHEWLNMWVCTPSNFRPTFFSAVCRPR